MAILAVLLFVGASRAGDPGASWLPAGTGLRKLLVVVGATVLFVALLPYVGMIVGTGLFLLGILRFLERYPWTQAAGVAAGTAVANYLIFTYWLRVPFPVSVLGF
jgi:putative tricarboxylic transport membrane protein